MLPFAALLPWIALAPLLPPSPLGTALSRALSQSRGHHLFVLCFRPPLWNAGAPRHARIREFHGCGQLVFRRGRRHSKYAFSAPRCSARKHHRHDRVGVADPRPGIAMNQNHFGGIHTAFFIFHGEQSRRCAPPGGLAVVSRLSERRTVLVGVATLLAPMVGYTRCRAHHFLRAREKSG